MTVPCFYLQLPSPRRRQFKATNCQAAKKRKKNSKRRGECGFVEEEPGGEDRFWGHSLLQSRSERGGTARVTGFPIHKKKGTCKNFTLQLWSRLVLEDMYCCRRSSPSEELTSFFCWFAGDTRPRP
ncbi:hypothetical protein AVEN_152420-1 [Araneus ventricosus]|uniref:Uncharacterized protein n=1 Tax=Araneus ventricosus TaxID=182803 RepID=A0A4Y2G7Y3_ARAVE|nr:hypothetical protein AVEN_152420-1 [Araneus ventricosus]